MQRMEPAPGAHVPPALFGIRVAHDRNGLGIDVVGRKNSRSIRLECGQVSLGGYLAAVTTRR